LENNKIKLNKAMVTISMELQILFAGLLFLLGLVGVLVRRNIIFMLMSIEVMLNSAGLVFIIAGSHWIQTDGQVMFIFILTIAAVEVAIGLALILQIYHHYKTLDVDAFNKLRDINT
jgi:NADH-quinone oxidoreductase subunit K